MNESSRVVYPDYPRGRRCQGSACRSLQECPLAGWSSDRRNRFPRTTQRSLARNTSIKGDAGAPQFLSKGTGPFSRWRTIHLIFWGAEWVNPILRDSSTSEPCGGYLRSAFMSAAYEYGNFGSVSGRLSHAVGYRAACQLLPTPASPTCSAEPFLRQPVPRPDSETRSISSTFVYHAFDCHLRKPVGARGKHKFFNLDQSGPNKTTKARYAWTPE